MVSFTCAPRATPYVPGPLAEQIIFVILMTRLPCSALASEQACVDYGPQRTPAWTIVHWS